ncbi:MAG: hypothetical protein Q4F45_02970 [Alistipes sp.]|nr:hypothetical protein [Alistipes sp.]MDO5496821.1 hypothetical protein [Alistipes sp.]
MRIFTHLIASIFGAALWLTSCGSNDITLMEDVNISSWREDVVLEFNNVEDNSTYNIDMVLHVNSRYTAQSCQMIVSVTTPDSMHTSEIVTIHTPTTKQAPGASARDIVIPYRTSVVMPKSGPYYYTMRPSSPLEGVEAAGFTFKHQQ